jgi:hypothetical protein
MQLELGLSTWVVPKNVKEALATPDTLREAQMSFYSMGWWTLG